MVEQTGYTMIFKVACKDADWVHLVGDFNHWSPHATPMRQVKPGLWQTELRLPPGDYRFRYLSSNQGWITDWAAFGVERNQFGDWDSIVHVPIHSKLDAAAKDAGDSHAPIPLREPTDAAQQPAASSLWRLSGVTAA